MAYVRAFTRELMADADRDLSAKLDWVAVDHWNWNTDNPHIHVLVRGRADDKHDLVISRDYAQALRAKPLKTTPAKLIASMLARFISAIALSPNFDVGV